MKVQAIDDNATKKARQKGPEEDVNVARQMKWHTSFSKEVTRPKTQRNDEKNIGK